MTTREMNSVVVFDLETTSVDPAKAKILELGAVKVVAKTGQIEDTMSVLIRPDDLMDVPPEASAVNHLTMADLEGGLSYDDAKERFRDFCRDIKLMAAHNLEYDWAVLAANWNIVSDYKRHICTMRLAKHVMSDLPGYSLQALRYRLLLELDGTTRADRASAHSALADAMVGAKLLHALIAQYVQSGNRVANLTDLATLCWSPIPIKTIPFGKHKGAQITEPPDDYLEWCLAKMEQLDDDCRAAFEAELKRRERSNTN